MFGSQILEVAIGLIFVYLMFSLICSGLKEWIHHLLDIRSKSLEEAIHRMVGNPALVEAIYSHPMVEKSSQAGIFKKTMTDPVETSKSTVNKGPKPIDIPTPSFAKAFLDSILKDVSEKGIVKAGKEEYDKIMGSIAKIENPAVKKVLTDLLTELSTQVAISGEEFLKKVALAQSQVEKWFDNSMQKLTLWYRKKTKQLIFVLTMIFVFAFNVDTFMIVRTLSQDPQLRAATYTTAEVLAKQDPITNTQELKALKAQLTSSGLPLGWVKSNSKDSDVTDPRAKPEFYIPGLNISEWRIDVWGWIWKLLGLLISLLAISMGAPFWFDALRQLFDMRKKLQGGDSNISDSSVQTVVVNNPPAPEVA